MMICTRLVMHLYQVEIVCQSMPPGDRQEFYGLNGDVAYHVYAAKMS